VVTGLGGYERGRDRIPPIQEEIVMSLGALVTSLVQTTGSMLCTLGSVLAGLG
jgi:hypothetical protein